VTDIKDQLSGMFGDEPPAPYDIERIVAAGRRARRRRNVAVAAAGTVGVAGLGAAVAIPVMATGAGGNDIRVGVQTQPTSAPTPTTPANACYLVRETGGGHRQLARLLKSGKVGTDPDVKKIRVRHDSGPIRLEVCANGTTVAEPTDAPAPPAGPRYHYSEEPQAIASRLASRLHDRVTGFDLAITYSRPFAQESSTLEKGHPSYYDGNVDVRVGQGYGDIGVQVTHKTTEQVPFDGGCAAVDHCVETTLADGSVLRTGQVDAGPGNTVLTAEVHRPDGVIVQAQESNYPFGPDAGMQKHGDQPLALDQLVGLAEDPHFTF